MDTFIIEYINLNAHDRRCPATATNINYLLNINRSCIEEENRPELQSSFRGPES